jgi:hypothetical protein
LAATSMAIHTWTEMRRMFQPIGIDKWSYDLAFKHGMRDGLTCRVGGRWVVSFRSRKELSSIVTRPMRVLICAAASFAALRLDQIVDPDPAATPYAVKRDFAHGVAFQGNVDDMARRRATSRLPAQRRPRLRRQGG